MTGREARVPEQNPDALEVVPGREREAIQGWVPKLVGEDDLRDALEKAFDYRGNVTITRKDGSTVEGYIFDRRMGATLATSSVRLIPTDSREKVHVTFNNIARLEFSGRDMAAGKNWENWVRSYWERKAAGEKNIGLQPESLE